MSTIEQGRAFNLADIIEDGHNYDRTRIVDFTIQDGQLLVGECCDEFFGTALNADEVDKLIAWLTDARKAMTR